MPWPFWISRENGFLINSVYAKEGGYSYIKEIVNGESAIPLSEEEQAALGQSKKPVLKNLDGLVYHKD